MHKLIVAAIVVLSFQSTFAQEANWYWYCQCYENYESIDHVGEVWLEDQMSIKDSQEMSFQLCSGFPIEIAPPVSFTSCIRYKDIQGNQNAQPSFLARTKVIMHPKAK